MKSIACILVLLVLCQSSAFGGVMQGVLKDPRYPGKCTIRENLILSPGQIVTDEGCTRVTCGNHGVVQFAMCGSMHVQGCKFGDYKDKTAPYPKCCERHLICPKA